MELKRLLYSYFTLSYFLTLKILRKFFLIHLCSKNIESIQLSHIYLNVLFIPFVFISQSFKDLIRFCCDNEQVLI